MAKEDNIISDIEEDITAISYIGQNSAESSDHHPGNISVVHNQR